MALAVVFAGVGEGALGGLQAVVQLVEAPLVLAPVGVDEVGEAVVRQLEMAALRAKQAAIFEGGEQPPQGFRGRQWGQVGLRPVVEGHHFALPFEADRALGAFFRHESAEHFLDRLGRGARVAFLQPGLQDPFLFGQEAVEHIVDLAEKIDLGSGEFQRRIAVARPALGIGALVVFAPEQVEIYLHVRQRHAGFEVVDDLPGIGGTFFEGDPEMGARLQDDLLQAGPPHGFYPQPPFGEMGDLPLEAVETGKVLLPHDEQEHAGGGLRRLQDGRHQPQETIDLFFLPQDQQLFELVEDQVHGPHVAGADPLQGVEQALIAQRRAAEGPRAAHFGQQRFVEVVAPADVEGHPIGRLETIGQAALHQAGLAGARGAVHQHDAVLLHELVQLLYLFFPTEKEIAILSRVGVEKLEGRADGMAILLTHRRRVLAGWCAGRLPADRRPFRIHCRPVPPGDRDRCRAS